MHVEFTERGEGRRRGDGEGGLVDGPSPSRGVGVDNDGCDRTCTWRVDSWCGRETL